MKHYTVSDGKIVLRLREAFADARDALAALSASRRKLIRKLASLRA